MSEGIKSGTTSEQTQHQTPPMPHNPSDDYPPTRPGPILIALTLAVIVAGFSFENWPDIVSAAKAVGL